MCTEAKACSCMYSCHDIDPAKVQIQSGGKSCCVSDGSSQELSDGK